MRRILAVCLLLCLVCHARASAADRITTETLLGEMISMVRLGQYPEPSYKTIQFSSYDRRSSIPGGAEWYANSDGFGGEPTPNFEEVLEEPNNEGVGRYLICDVKGPGAVVRTWSARIEGTIRVVLDGADEPLYDGSAQEFLQNGLQQYVTEAGLAEDEFVGSFRQRDACYFPIAFSKQCRIEWTGDPKKIHFYEVQVRCYDGDAEVTTFNCTGLKQQIQTIRDTAKVLSKPQENWVYQSQLSPVAIQAAVKPGEVVQLLEMTGPSAIERLTLRVTANDMDRALRQTVLRITFDDHASAQVQCPVGDFFGAAPGINPYDAIPFTVEADGTMTSRFVMPFAKKCSVQLENLGSQPVQVAGTALPLDIAWNDVRSMHFRARWRVDHDLVANGGAGAQDLPFLLANGAGVYVGTTVMLLNPNPIPHPYGSWWGEGDEKIFIDGDKRPSTFGTGSEDYFNYSWSSPDIFLFAYCGQPRNDGPGNRGFVTNQRWHIIDALPFRERIAFYMELYSHERNENFSYARIGYHYGRPGIMDDFVGLTKEDVRPLQLPANWQPAARFGAHSSEFFQAHNLISDQAKNTSLERAELWADGQLLVWKPKAGNESLDLDVPVSKAGKYAIHIVAAKTAESGRIAVALDGKPLRFRTEDGTIDLKTDYRVLLRNFSSSEVELDEGNRRLSFRLISGQDATDAGKLPMIGIDFIWIQKR